MPDVHFAPDTCSYLGSPADFVANISLSYLGDMQLELIAPVSGHNVYSDFLRDRGPGLHHICVEADTRRVRCRAGLSRRRNGAPVVAAGVMPGGLRFAYVSAPQYGVPFMEIAYIPPRCAQFFDYIKQEQQLNDRHPGNSERRRRRRPGRTRSTSWCSASASAVAARPSARPPPAHACWCWSEQRQQAARPRWLGGTSTSAAAPRSRRRPATPTRPRRCTSIWSRCRVNPTTSKIRAYCDGSVEHFNWLEDLGFQFERSFYPGKVVVPPGTEGLSYTGNEKVWPFCEQAKPAPRGHSVPVPGELGGASMVIDLLVKRADDVGRAVPLRDRSNQSHPDDDGAVVGVGWKHFGETGAVKAKSVIIAAGGFAMNPEMVAEHTPALGQPRRTKHHGPGGALHPGQPQRRRPRHPDGCLGGRGRPRTWTRCSSPRRPIRRRSC